MAMMVWMLPAFGELGADGEPEAVRAHRGPPSGPVRPAAVQAVRSGWSNRIVADSSLPRRTKT